jgi:hypothetical protein
MARIAKGTTIDDAKTSHNDTRVDFTGCTPSEPHVKSIVCSREGYFKALFSDKFIHGRGHLARIEAALQGCMRLDVPQLPAEEVRRPAILGIQKCDADARLSLRYSCVAADLFSN